MYHKDEEELDQTRKRAELRVKKFFSDGWTIRSPRAAKSDVRMWGLQSMTRRLNPSTGCVSTLPSTGKEEIDQNYTKFISWESPIKSGHDPLVNLFGS